MTHQNVIKKGNNIEAISLINKDYKILAEYNLKNIAKIFNEKDLIISEGSIVRVIREPYFGKIGKVVSLPPELIKMKSETKVRVAKIEFDNKKEIIPRANLEVILSN